VSESAASPPPGGAEEGVDVSPILDEVERRLRERAESTSPFVTEAARYLIEAGGKRFRPMLVALSGHLGEPKTDLLADAGVVVELVHLATLYHDDVMDEATARRGTEAANLRWGNTVAILTGDYLFARASELSADLGVEVTRIMARTIATLCEGQIRDIQGSRGVLPDDVPRVDADLDHYLDVIAKKTASLIATSCRLGTLLSGCPPEEIEAASGYGWNLGMAFQLSDDVLDITSDEEISGKSPGTDLRQGLRTIPVLYALEDDPDGELAGLLDRDVLSEHAVSRSLQILRESPALERAVEHAGQYAADAAAALDGFPDGPAIRGLRHLADYTVMRTS
jgi:heptaprenyl diphosphate synthase